MALMLIGQNLMGPADTRSTFTKIYEAKDRPILFENDSFFAIWDAFPVNPGHALVISKRQTESLFDLDEEEWTDLQEALTEARKKIRATNFEDFYRARVAISERKLKEITRNLGIPFEGEAFDHSISNLDEETHKSAQFFSKRRGFDLAMLGILENLEKIKADSFNIGVNEGREAGRTIDNLHWHMIPRFDGDKVNPVGGLRGIFPERADYKK